MALVRSALKVSNFEKLGSQVGSLAFCRVDRVHAAWYARGVGSYKENVMLKTEYDSVVEKMHKHMDIQKSSKDPKPEGSVNSQTFRSLPEDTLFWMVWALGPDSWVTPAKTRKIHSFDSRDDHMGAAWVIDWNKQFPITDLTDDKYKDEDYRKYKTEYYSNYNLDSESENYNDSYVFLNEQDALAYLEVCKGKPRFKTEEEKKMHEETMAELEAISDRMTYDFINDPMYDD